MWPSSEAEVRPQDGEYEGAGEEENYAHHRRRHHHRRKSCQEQQEKKEEEKQPSRSRSNSACGSGCVTPSGGSSTTATAVSSATGALRRDAPLFIPGTPQTRSSSSSFLSFESEEDGDQQPVISVKKSSRGCAVVLLRDPALVERGVKQSVAIIDGVCVELRRHVHRKAAEDGTPQAAGLFVGWGHRVERKASVSLEGIAAYFNRLAELPIPEGLEVSCPFEEGCLRFTLSSSGKIQPLNMKPSQDRAERGRLLSNVSCEADLVERLWSAKGRLDALWNLPPPPLARGLMSRVARAQLFPHSGAGDKEHENRAGDKLDELLSTVGLLDGLPTGSAFLDLCGGPGAWSLHLLDHGPELRGYGFTLRSESGSVTDWKAEAKDQWYYELIRDPRWRPLWGADGTGDLLKLGNLQHVAKKLLKDQVMLVAADGGFSDKTIPANLLELYFYRLLLGEILMAVTVLREGGRFICKLYSTLSASTSALLYLLTRVFERVEIVKPKTSRVTGPERYLVCFGFRPTHSETNPVKAALLKSHEAGGGASPLELPLLQPCVATSDLESDTAFAESLRRMSTELCERQARALSAVVDRAEYLENMALDQVKDMKMKTPAKVATEEADLPSEECKSCIAEEDSACEDAVEGFEDGEEVLAELDTPKSCADAGVEATIEPDNAVEEGSAEAQSHTENSP